MAERDPRVVLLPFSDRGCLELEALAVDAGASVTRVLPQEEFPGDFACAMLAAIGCEGDAVDWISRSAGTAGPPLVVFGGRPDHRLAAAALQAGATDYFNWPDDAAVARRRLERLIRDHAAKDAAGQAATEEREVAGFDSVIGSSAAMREVLSQAARVAGHGDVTVLLQGETGTGKEVLARAIHLNSPRAGQPFIVINCAAIPENLLESELFGHERGAFTGAVATKAGLFEQAHGGTILLDEVGHLPFDLQAKLLRALESREIRRVGGRDLKKIDVRVIAATHVDLAAAVTTGDFREDLFYRLDVVTLRLPPLRERGSDIEELAEAFTRSLAGQHGLPEPALRPEVRGALRAHQWPGNVRELRNAVERALVLSQPGTLELDQLRLDQGAKGDQRRAQGGLLPFPATVDEITRAAVLAALERTRGNKSEAARMLGISRPRLQRWLDRDDD